MIKFSVKLKSDDCRYARFTGGRQRTNEEYLMANRSMPIWLVFVTTLNQTKNFTSQARRILSHGFVHERDHLNWRLKRKLPVWHSVHRDKSRVWHRHSDLCISLLAGVLQHASDKCL